MKEALIILLISLSGIAFAQKPKFIKIAKERTPDLIGMTGAQIDSVNTTGRWAIWQVYDEDLTRNPPKMLNWAQCDDCIVSDQQPAPGAKYDPKYGMKIWLTRSKSKQKE